MNLIRVIGETLKTVLSWIGTILKSIGDWFAPSGESTIQIILGIIVGLFFGNKNRRRKSK